VLIFSWFGKRQGHLTQDELSAYVDGGPGAPSPAEVANHLRDCDSSCEADLAQLRITLEILGSIAPIEPPRSFALTAEMVADLPDGKPLGSPPRMSWDGTSRRNSRVPTYIPAFAATAAAIVFALVLVGDLTGTISQSGSRSSDAALSAPAAGVQEMAVNEAAAASQAAPAGVPEIASFDASAKPDSAVVVTVVVEKEVAVEAQAAPVAPPAVSAVESAAVAEIMPTPALLGTVAQQRALAASDNAGQPSEEASEPVPEISLAGEAVEAPTQKGVAPDTAQLSTEDLPVAGATDGGTSDQLAGQTDDAPAREPERESVPPGDIPVIDLESIPTRESKGNAIVASESAPALGVDQAPGILPITVDSDDDDSISLPVWQLLLATGLLALGLAITAVTIGRRSRLN
jgi:hypothetical protein